MTASHPGHDRLEHGVIILLLVTSILLETTIAILDYMLHGNLQGSNSSSKMTSSNVGIPSNYWLLRLSL